MAYNISVLSYCIHIFFFFISEIYTGISCPIISDIVLIEQDWQNAGNNQAQDAEATYAKLMPVGATTKYG